MLENNIKEMLTARILARNVVLDGLWPAHILLGVLKQEHMLTLSID